MGTRFAGVDAARGLAIVGMLVAHVADDGSAESLADGRSSVLFATLAGLSLGLITGGPRRPSGARAHAALATVALRGLVLLALGLGLWTLGTPIAVILDYYGFLFLVLLPVVLAPVPVVAAVAVVAAIAGPLLVSAGGRDLAVPFSARRLPDLVTEWSVTGYYPGVVWAAYLCAGLVAARADLSRRRTLLAMVVGGGLTSLLGYGGARLAHLDATAHADTTAEVLGAGGLALAAVGALQLACASGAGPAVQRALAPLIAMGAMPLTIYAAQLVVLAVWLLTPAAGEPPGIASWPLLTALVVGSAAFSMFWRRRVGRGPLEWVVRTLTTIGPARGRAVR